MLISNIASGEIAIEYGITGPNYSVSSACATANHALGASLRHLRYGDADVLIAGGAEAAITALGYAGFCQARALTPGFNDCPKKPAVPSTKTVPVSSWAKGPGSWCWKPWSTPRPGARKSTASWRGSAPPTTPITSLPRRRKARPPRAPCNWPWKTRASGRKRWIM
jgi:hypothetical protein